MLSIYTPGFLIILAVLVNNTNYLNETFQNMLMKEQHEVHKQKFVMSDAAMLGLAAIFSIFLIVYITIHSASVPTNTDLAGQASSVTLESQSRGLLCNIIVGQTDSYDRNVMAVGLSVGESTYYRGYTVSVESITEEGCMIGVNGNKDYIAIGQIAKIEPVYITVKDIVG